MGAVCKVCGKDMMKAKGCCIAKVHVCGKVYDRIKVGAPVISMRVSLKPPDAMTATQCSVIFIIGAVMQNAARLAAVN